LQGNGLAETAAPHGHPVCPPDLTSLDFFFWGNKKNADYTPPLSVTIPQLSENIWRDAATVVPSLLNN
jgi:hypothetical protein